MAHIRQESSSFNHLVARLLVCFLTISLFIMHGSTLAAESKTVVSSKDVVNAVEKVSQNRRSRNEIMETLRRCHYWK